MSRYHEVILWESPDGTWNYGRYAVAWRGDGDDEWDVEFDFSAFEWVSCGHESEHSAHQAWTGSNPGGSSSWAFEASDSRSVDRTAAFEDMAARLYEEEQAQPADPHGYRHRAYTGPPKQRTLAALQRDLSALRADHVRHRLGGYSNLASERLGPLAKQIAERLKTATAAEMSLYEKADAERRTALRQHLADHRAERTSREQQARGYAYRPGAIDRSSLLDEREAEVQALIEAADRDALQRSHGNGQQIRASTPGALTRSRQPRGVPTGGQFAASERDESGVTLATPPVA